MTGSRALDRRALAAGVLLIALAATLSVLASVYDTFPGDQRAGEWARSLGGGFEPIAQFLNRYDMHLGIALGVLAFVLLWWRRQYDAMAITVLLGLSRPLFHLLKPIVDRPRPAGDVPVPDITTTASFPSGHVLTAATVAAIWIIVAPRLLGPRTTWLVRGLSVAAVVLMALARMWEGAHWWSDTYGATIWVAAVATLILSISCVLRPLTPIHRE